MHRNNKQWNNQEVYIALVFIISKIIFAFANFYQSCFGVIECDTPPLLVISKRLNIFKLIMTKVTNIIHSIITTFEKQIIQFRKLTSEKYSNPMLWNSLPRWMIHHRPVVQSCSGPWKQICKHILIEVNYVRRAQIQNKLPKYLIFRNLAIRIFACMRLTLEINTHIFLRFSMLG